MITENIGIITIGIFTQKLFSQHSSKQNAMQKGTIATKSTSNKPAATLFCSQNPSQSATPPGLSTPKPATPSNGNPSQNHPLASLQCDTSNLAEFWPMGASFDDPQRVAEVCFALVEQGVGNFVAQGLACAADRLKELRDKKRLDEEEIAHLEKLVKEKEKEVLAAREALEARKRVRDGL